MLIQINILIQNMALYLILCSLFLFQNFDWVGVGNSSSVLIGNRKKGMLVLSKGPTEEAEYPIKLLSLQRTFYCKSLLQWYNSFLFVNATRIYYFEARNSEIKPCPLWLGNISKDLVINRFLRKQVLMNTHPIFLLITILLIIVILSIFING